MRKNEVDEILRTCLIEATERGVEKLNEQMENMEPHVFSEEFEQKMAKLFNDRRKQIKRRKVYYFAATMAAVLVLCVGIVTATHTASASLPSIDIKGWFDKYFEFSKGAHTETDEIIFSEEQIAYIPEGFIKTEEEQMRTYSNYVYENQAGDFFYVRVGMTLVQSQQDNENIIREVLKGENGYEYARTKQADQITYVWEDDKGLYYYVCGNIAEEDLLLIMSGIQEGDNK